ncbi:MAG: tetratricopeptide repeat protein [Verrucomicrobiales bacterium]|nr:tetratricopeptide repeat protein [Verrucomicrobiales bacterium]
MKSPPNAEFAQFRFVRDAEGGVIPLPSQGIDEKNLLVLDCERWGLARLHIFEGAAVREDKLEAFQGELKQIADLRSDSVTRLITWGRDSEELFYADEMQDGEPLPEYLDRCGGVPFSVAAHWIVQLCDFLEKVPTGLPSFDRFTTLNFQVVIDRFHQVRPVFSEFYGWTRPGAQVQDHAREWYLAQIFCSLIAGVPVRTFYEASLPRNFDELDEHSREVVLGALSENSQVSFERLRSAMEILAQDAEEQRALVRLPRFLVREWMREDLAASYQGSPEFEIVDFRDPERERYATQAVIRGKESFVQLLPGPLSIPREGWLNQHHDATRRLGRPMLHQLHVNYLEDRDSLTLVGEESIEGVSLASLLLRVGPRAPEEVVQIMSRVSSTVDSLEKNTGSCAVWWLPPENILLLSGTRSVPASVHLLERKGGEVWREWGMKLRLHQTTSTLREGVNLPGAVRSLSRVPGKNNEAARRSALALPLIFFALTTYRFRWRRPVRDQSDLPESLSNLLESFREKLLQNPEAVENDLFLEFLNSDSSVEEDHSAGEEKSPEEPLDDGFDSMLESTLFQEKIELTEPADPIVTSSEINEGGEGINEPDWEDEFDAPEMTGAARFFRGWWLALWAVVVALFAGYFFAGWNSRLGNFEDRDGVRFPVSDYLVPAAPTPAEVVADLETYLVEESQPDLLPYTSELGSPESRSIVDEFLNGQIEEGDATAARLNALLVGLDGAPIGEVVQRFEEAARLGDLSAQFDLAVLSLVKGLGNADPESVREMLVRSAKSGNLNSKELLGILLLDEGKPGEARRQIEAAAGKDHLGSQYHLGLFEANGTGGSVDPRAAAGMFEAAAVRGDVRSMFALGRCYEIGFGKPADFTEATRWIKMAAALDYQSAVAWCQARGLEVSPDQ